IDGAELSSSQKDTRAFASERAGHRATNRPSRSIDDRVLIFKQHCCSPFAAVAAPCDLDILAMELTVSSIVPRDASTPPGAEAHVVPSRGARVAAGSARLLEVVIRRRAGIHRSHQS